MPTLTIIAACAAFAAALIALLISLLIYNAVVVKPALAQLHALAETHDSLIGGGAGASSRLAAIEDALRTGQAGLERLAGRVSELEALSRTDISRVGFLRYDAFDESGAELSYALALLNRDGNGVVISSIYSRADTRTFGKAVTAYRTAQTASEEELRAIEQARSW